MKIGKYIFLVLIPAVLSCTKVIDINLNDAAPKIIIEGSISDHYSSCKVKLSKTINFDEPNTFPALTGSLVTISDDWGNKVTLNETDTGIYESPGYLGVSGRTYTISVTSDGTKYTASSTMPFPVEVDSLIQGSFNMGHFGKTGIIKFAKIYFQDPVGEKNYYRFIEKVNNTISAGIQIDNDNLSDGNFLSREIEHTDTGLRTGDTVTVFLQTIDKDVYSYLSQLKETIGQGTRGPTFAPGKSPTNFDNGALGYFSAAAVRSETIVIK